MARRDTKAKTPYKRALQLAERQCTDPEICAVLQHENLATGDAAHALIVEHSVRLGIARTAGQGLMRARLHEQAHDNPSLMAFLAHNELGYFRNGADREVVEKLRMFTADPAKMRKAIATMAQRLGIVEAPPRVRVEAKAG